MTRLDYGPMKVPEGCEVAFGLHRGGWTVGEVAAMMGIGEDEAREQIVRVWRYDRMRKVMR